MKAPPSCDSVSSDRTRCQIVRHVERVREVDRIDVRHPEQIAVGGIANFVQRFDQLGVGHLQLGQLEDLGVATGQQRVQQLALGAKLGIDDALLLVGQRAAVVAFEFALRQFFQLVFKLQALHAQLGHVAVQLLRQASPAASPPGRAGFPQRRRRAEPLGLFDDGAQRLAHLQRLRRRLPLLRRNQIHALRLAVQRGGQFAVDLQLLADAFGKSPFCSANCSVFQRQFRFALALGVEVVAQRLQLNVYFLVALL